MLFPTPSFSFGVAVITELLLGAMNAPKEKPIITAIKTSNHIELFIVTKTAPIINEIIILATPTVAIYLASILSEREPANTADSAMATGVPRMMSPVCICDNSSISCKKKGN